MRSIGVRKLRQHASEYLRLANEGETIEVTDRGRPVALIVPLPESRIERMIREGLIVPAQNPGSLCDIEPLPRNGERPLSEVLMEMRESERF